jgi:hypothetical protein
MSKKGDRLRDKAEELRTNADSIGVEECHRISLELGRAGRRTSDRWGPTGLTIAMYLGKQAPAK